MTNQPKAAPAFTVQGEPITPAQRDAGLAAMRGRFKAANVREALSRAGVENIDRAADRLMQGERKAGRIRAVDNKNWEKSA
jgi:hypothetical protein